MNHANYKKLLQEKLIPNLESKSVIVVNNATYHNIQFNRHPTSNARKYEMLFWLDEHGIRYSSDMTKAELYCTTATGCQLNCSWQICHIISYHTISYHNSGNNWTHCVNSKLSVILKQWWWNCLIFLLNSQFTMLLVSLSYVFIVGSNAGYTMFRGSVKGTGYLLHSPVSPSLPLPCVTMCHRISTGLYHYTLRKRPEERSSQQLL